MITSSSHVTTMTTMVWATALRRPRRSSSASRRGFATGSARLRRRDSPDPSLIAGSYRAVGHRSRTAQARGCGVTDDAIGTDTASFDAVSAAPHDDRNRREGRLRRIVHSRSADFGTATVRRFLGVDGFTHATLLSIELFTTVIPLIIISFAYRNDFASDANLGDRFIALLGLSGERAQDVHDLFGSADGIRSTWSVAGVAGFLLWGIPMAITVASMYARAWQRPAFDLWGKL